MFDAQKVPHETAVCELALLNLGDFEPLNIHVDTNLFMHEIDAYRSEWVDYLPRTDRPNNRKGLALTNLPGKTHRDNPSLAQASYEAGRRLSECDFSAPTEMWHSMTSLKWLHEWEPLGRTFLVKSDTGGYFVPHRDHPSMPRDVFRLAVFLNNCGPLQYDWWMDDRKLNIQHGTVYYINTRKTHRTISWVNDSIHLIVNVPFTSANVARVIGSLQHSH